MLLGSAPLEAGIRRVGFFVEPIRSRGRGSEKRYGQKNTPPFAANTRRRAAIAVDVDPTQHDSLLLVHSLRAEQPAQTRMDDSKPE